MSRFCNLFKFAGHLSEANVALCNFTPRRYLKFATDVKWVRPDKKTLYHPSNTGDLNQIELPSKDTIRLDFQDSEELKNASEAVKKVFSLQYLPLWYSYRVYEKQLVDKVRNHPYDESSLEVYTLKAGETSGKDVCSFSMRDNHPKGSVKVIVKKYFANLKWITDKASNCRAGEMYVAKLTAKIHYYQPLLEKATKRKNKKRMIVPIKESIDKRKKVLRLLRSKDYKKFEWILDQLNIVYKPAVNVAQSVTRKTSLELLAKLRVAKQKEEKLAELKKNLDQKKVPFLEKKIEKLKWIKEMEEKNNVPITVTDSDINECIEKLEKVKIEVAQRSERSYMRKIHPYTLEPYDEYLLHKKEKGSTSA